MGEVVSLAAAMHRAQQFVQSCRAGMLVATTQEEMDTVEAALRDPPCVVPDWHLARLDAELARRRRSLWLPPDGGHAA